MLTAVTSFSPKGYATYGQRFIETYARYWPCEVNLLCAWEGTSPDSGLNGFDLLSYEPAKAFLERHKNNKVVQGKEESPTSAWGPKARREGYSLKHDAYKFARKVFAVAAAAKYVERGRLFWVDADVVSHSKMPTDVLLELLPSTVSLCYLKRRKFYSELGFVGYNLDRKETRKFLSAYEDQYATDAFLKDQYWDDCNQFDYLVNKLVPHVKWIKHNSEGHPFDDSVLRHYMTHLKGRRKYAGLTPQSLAGRLA